MFANNRRKFKRRMMRRRMTRMRIIANNLG